MKKERSNHKKHRLFISIKHKILSFFDKIFLLFIPKDQIDILLTSVEKENDHDILIELKKEIITSKNKLKKQKSIVNQIKLKKIIKAEAIINAKLDYFKQQQEINNIEIEIDFHNSNPSKKLDKTSDKTSKKANTSNHTETHKNKIIDLNDPDILEFLKYMNLEIYNIEYQLKKDMDYAELKYLEKRILNLIYKRKNFYENYDFKKLEKIFCSKDKYSVFKNNNILEKLQNECNLKKVAKASIIDNKTKTDSYNIDNFDDKVIKKVNVILQKQMKNTQESLIRLQKNLTRKDNIKYNDALLEKLKLALKERISYNCYTKNALLDQLIFSFNLNNHIRKIRNLICEEQINFATLTNNIYNNKNCLFNICLVNEDTITQIEFLKYELISKYSFTDLKSIFNKLYKLEILTIKQNND